MNLVGNLNGFHPLDATGSEHLQLSINSCRRAAWWARLGPCRPLTVSVGSLVAGGGPAGVVKGDVLTKNYKTNVLWCPLIYSMKVFFCLS